MKGVEENKCNIIDRIIAYKPGCLDLFGYDISGKRKRLIKDLLVALKENQEEEIIPYLHDLESSLYKRKIDQDISLSVLLNVLKNKKYNLKHVDNSLKRLLIAGERPYHDLQVKLELNKEEQQLMQKVLERVKEISSLKAAVEIIMNEWLMKSLKNLSKLQPKNKSSYKKKVYKIISDVYNILKIKPATDLEKIKKFRINEDINEGELAEYICSHIAKNLAINHPENYIKIRKEIIDSLPIDLKRKHSEYSKQCVLQVNSLRLLKIFENSKTLENLSSSLLEIFNDDSFYSAFKQHINKLISKDKGRLKWKTGFSKEIISAKDFQDLIKEALENANLRGREYENITKRIEVFKKKPKLLLEN